MIRRDWLKKGLACSLYLGGIVAYQNCGGKFSASNTTTQSSFANTNVAEAAVAYRSGADVAWSMKSSSMPELNRFGRATRWFDYKKSGLNLYAPILPGTQTLNTDASGLVEQFNGTSYLTFQPDASMSVAVADVGQFVFDNVTILLVFTNLQLPSATGGTIRLFSLFPSNGDVAGTLVIDASSGANGGVDFVMTDWFDQNNYNQLKMNVTMDQLKSPVAIAARFDKDGSKMGLSINGQITDSKITVKGAVSGLGLVARTFTVHAASGTFGSGGTFSLGEFLIYHQSFDDAHLQTASSVLSLEW